MAEKEYIERDKVLRDWPLCDEPADAYQYIKSYPAADVRPVVLCRDCKSAPIGDNDGDELVKRLRLCAEGFRCRECDYGNVRLCRWKMNNEAADAIEELSRRETPMKITEIHVDEYYCPACGAENNCDQGHVQDAYCPACGQRLLPQPPKEE